VTGILEMFSELSEPDFYDVSAQLELFCWRERQRKRDSHRRWRTLHAAQNRKAQREYQAKRYAEDAMFRAKAVAREAARYATDPAYRARKLEYARARYARQRAAKRAA
jgi:hypothetical protein